MITQKVPQKTCPQCWRHLPRDHFRILNRAKRLRTSECNDCRCKRLRRERQAARQSALKNALTSIRRGESADQVLMIVRGLVRRLGGVDKMMELWTGLIQDAGAPEATRVKALETIMKMEIVADNLELSQFEQVNPAEFFPWLSERKQLAGLVRACLEDGLLTLDDIDPPPV